MGLIEHTADLMAQLVAGKIFGSSQARQPIVGQTAAPHQFTHGVIVHLIFICLPSIADHRAHQPLRDLIGHLVSLHRSEIPFQCMHQDVCDPAGQLIFGNGVGQFRIHQREPGTDQICVDARLLPCLLVGEHRGITGLASGR